MGRRTAVLAAFLIATCAVTGIVWWFALRDSLSRLAERGQADLALAGDRLTGQLQRYREMTVLMAAMAPSASRITVTACFTRTEPSSPAGNAASARQKARISSARASSTLCQTSSKR